MKNYNQDLKKEIEEKAKMFASKFPKMTNFNNTKSNKYFSSSSEDYFNGTVTIKDTLVHNNNINTNTYNSLKNDVNYNKNHPSHKRAPSNILKVSKEIVKS